MTDGWLARDQGTATPPSSGPHKNLYRDRPAETARRHILPAEVVLYTCFVRNV